MALLLDDEAITAWYRGWFERNYGTPCGRVNPSIIAAIRDAISEYVPPSAPTSSCALGESAVSTCAICDV